MALDFTDFTTLKSSIADELKRTDMTDSIPGFIKLVEAEMARTLKTGDEEASTTLTLTTTGSVALPTGFLKARRLRYYDGTTYTDLTQNALVPSNYDGVTQGRPIVVSIVGANLQSRPKPDQSYTLALDYFAKFTPLSASATTNWILTDHPDAYFYGALRHSVPFTGGTDVRAGIWAQGFTSAMEGIIRADYEKRMSQLQMRSDVMGINRAYPYNISTDQ